MSRGVARLLSRTGVQAVVVVLVALAVYLPTMTRAGGVCVDVMAADLQAWRIATTGHPSLAGLDLDAVSGGDPSRIFVGTASNGQLVAARAPGVVAVAVPAYALMGGPDDLSGFSLAPGALTAALLCALALAFLYSALRAMMSLRAAALSVAVVGLGTPLWAVGADSLWTHSLSAFALAGLAYAATRDRWWLAGAMGGVAFCARPHLAVAIAVFAVAMALVRRRPGIVVRTGVLGLAFALLASLWTHWLYGGWLPTGGYGSVGDVVALVDRPTWENELGLWLSPQRGMLPWTPVVLLLAPGSVRCWRRGLLPDWTIALTVAGIVYTCVQGALIEFTGGDTFYAYRLGLEMMMCAAPLVAVAASHASPRLLAWLGPVAGLQVGAIALGALTGFSVPQGEEWRVNEAVALLGQAPGLVVVVALPTLLGAWLVQRLGPPPTSGAGSRQASSEAALVDAEVR